MYSYLFLNLAVLSLVIGACFLGARRLVNPKPLLKVMVALLAITAVFDSVIVGLNLVSYDTSKILGLYVGRAPIEDFCYAIVAAIVVPILWERGLKK